MGMDSVDVDENNVESFNRYAYANNNPTRFVDPDGNSPIDVAFLALDLVNLGAAVYSGVGAGPALVDVGVSILSVASPVPGVGQVYKAGRAADKALDVARNVNGNSKLSTKAQHIYEIRNVDTGEVVKTGISSGKIGANGKSYRAKQQVRDWAKRKDDDGNLLCANCESTIIGEISAGARARALGIEASNAGGLRAAGQLKNRELHVRP